MNFIIFRSVGISWKLITEKNSPKSRTNVWTYWDHRSLKHVVNISYGNWLTTSPPATDCSSCFMRMSCVLLKVDCTFRWIQLMTQIQKSFFGTFQLRHMAWNFFWGHWLVVPRRKKKRKTIENLFCVFIKRRKEIPGLRNTKSIAIDYGEEFLSILDHLECEKISESSSTATRTSRESITVASFVFGKRSHHRIHFHTPTRCIHKEPKIHSKFRASRDENDVRNPTNPKRAISKDLQSWEKRNFHLGSWLNLNSDDKEKQPRERKSYATFSPRQKISQPRQSCTGVKVEKFHLINILSQLNDFLFFCPRENVSFVKWELPPVPEMR